MEINFKLAGPAEMETVLKLMSEFYDYERREFSFASPLDMQTARAALGKLFADPSLGRVWLIGAGEEPIGYVALTFCFSLEFGGHAAVVDELYIREQHRGKGAGLQTLQFAEEFCRGQGMKVLALEVDRKNTAAQRVYEKAGYEDRNNFLLTKWL